MDKMELHGATLPQGWMAQQKRRGADILIERVAPGQKWAGGAVTIDLERRLFGAGDCDPGRSPMNSPDHYKGRGWQKRLIHDACAWLEKTMTRTEKS